MPSITGRHELKHNINYADYLQLKARLGHVAPRDENSTNGSYRVRSLYFDNYADKALKEKIDGVDNREKFRIRLYNGDTSFIRLEKKSKHRGLCYKQSAPITIDQCQALLSCDFDALKAGNSQLCLEFYSKMRFLMLRPKNIVDYAREAFIYPPGNVRITLDSDIRQTTNVNSFLLQALVATPAFGATILEVKYDSYLPEVIRGIVSLSSRQSSSFSKYAVSRGGII